LIRPKRWKIFTKCLQVLLQNYRILQYVNPYWHLTDRDFHALFQSMKDRNMNMNLS
jgi:hypothetical protein